jgi:hypothetical protein
MFQGCENKLSDSSYSSGWSVSSDPQSLNRIVVSVVCFVQRVKVARYRASR